MARINYIQNSLLGGEFSPRILGRTDLPRYDFGAATIKNAVVKPYGGAYRRNGTKFIKEIESGTAARLIPFIFSEDEVYIIEFNDGVITAINRDSPFTTSTLASTEPGFGTTAPTAAQLSELQYAQSGDKLYITAPTLPPLVIRRLATNSFDFIGIIGKEPLNSEFDHERVPFDINQDSTHTLTPSATGGASRTLTSNKDLFDANMIGTRFRITQGADTGLAEMIAPFVSATVANVDIINDFGSTSASSDWAEQAWSLFRGYPRTVTFYKSRLVYGGNLSFPDTVWTSEVENFEKFSRTILSPRTLETIVASSPVTFTIASQKVNQIQWVSGGKRLNMGTLGDEYIISDISGIQAANATRETSHGSIFTQPVAVSNVLLFIETSGRSVREFAFEFDADNFRATNLSLLGEHMSDKARQEFGINSSGFTEIQLQEIPHEVAWVVGPEGILTTITREVQQDVAAWAYHLLGGPSEPLGGGLFRPTPFVQSIAVVPGDGGSDQVWMVVRRSIDGGAKIFIEAIGEDFRDLTLDSSESASGSGFSDEAFLDCYVTGTNGSPSRTLNAAALSTLGSETVQVVGDGSFLGEFTLSGGEITIPDSQPLITDYIVGFPYETVIKTLPLDRGSAIGSAHGLLKKIDRVSIRFYDTVGAQFGHDEDDLEDIVFRPASLPMDDAIPPFTGIKTLEFDDPTIEDDDDEKGYEGQVIIKQSLPYPMGVGSVTIRAQVYEG